MTRRISSRNAAFQQWQALLTNRNKRLRSGEFLVQGVRPITMAVRAGWTVRTLLTDGRERPSTWAQDLFDDVADAERVILTPDLMRELGEKAEGAPEVIAVVGMPPDDLDRIPTAGAPLVVVFDRPSGPGNIGTLARSADAFGASALLVTGHAADPYDPKAVRASTGSLFALPVIRVPSPAAVEDWIDAQPVRPLVMGTDETGDDDVRSVDLTRPLVLVVGNETNGMTAAWRERCDVLLRIPMGGTASSLNAATAGSIVLYEAARQRGPAAVRG